MTWTQRLRQRLADRKARQEGYVALLVAVLFTSGTLFGLAAISVDIASWYDKEQEVQKAADAAALAGVPYLPYDMTNATLRAKQVAARNGFDDASPNVVVTVTQGVLASQLQVTISVRVGNSFGSLIGVHHATLTRSATADYKGPAPMGSPCNTFGNEPSSGTGAATPTGSAQGTGKFSNCSTNPQFWASVEGPETTKVQGDRYQTKPCNPSGDNTAVDGCTNKQNTEYDPFGYVFVVKVQPAMVGKSLTLQLFDPEFAYTGQSCGALLADSGSTWATATNQTAQTNPYATNKDAQDRYTRDGAVNGHSSTEYCTGDSYPGTNAYDNHNPVITTFLLRQQTDTQDPVNAPVQNDTGGAACLKQYGAYAPAASTVGNVKDRWWTTTKTLTSGQTGYNADLAQVFHNWVNFCTFTPARAGDYYLQVRTDVTFSGSGNTITKNGTVSQATQTAASLTTGDGANAFAIRAVTPIGQEQQVAVSGYNHMPIFMNASSAQAKFNLLRVLPGAAGQYISFSFFDAGDASTTGHVVVTPPADATGSVTTTPFPGNCRAQGAAAGTSGQTLSNCDATISSAGNNGKTETITIPIPTDYGCNYASLGGCWYQVSFKFDNGADVHDQTTWDAQIIGDPVRLIK